MAASNPSTSQSAILLLADDDPDDRELACEALRDADVHNEVHTVEDGDELLDYLHRRGRHGGLSGTELPGLILLDLNMPRKDGRTALAEIKADRRLGRIPVVIMTTSSSEDDQSLVSELGAASFFTKPSSYAGLVEAMRQIKALWSTLEAARADGAS